MTEAGGTVRDAVARREGRAVAGQDPNGAVLALRDDQTWWSPRQLAALKALGIKNATQEDLLVFLHYCAKTKLDPFSKQVYLLERRSWNKAASQWEYTQTIQTGIDGYRVVGQRAAHREKIHIEYEDTVWFAADESEHKIWLAAEEPAGARVTVVKVFPDGNRLRFPAVAKFSSYAATSKDGKLMSQWGVMPDHMIEKCAEAFALRRAFPNDLGGTYIEEELQHEAPPALPARTRPPQAEDEWVVPSTAEDAREPEPPPDGQDGASEPPPDKQAPPDKPARPPRRTRSGAAKLMNKLFHQGGLGGEDNVEDRRAVVSYLLGSPDLITFGELSDEDVHKAAAELETLVGSVANTGGDITEVLARTAAYYLTHDEPPATEPAAEQPKEDTE